MRLHKFFHPFNPEIKKLTIEDKKLVNQIKNVLRLTAGDQIILKNNQAQNALLEIKSLTNKTIETQVLKITENQNEPINKVTLYLSILKRENFEIAVQKAVEVGVQKIVPLISRRTVKLNFKKERLEKIIEEAAEQSDRGLIPELQQPILFREALGGSQTHDLRLFFDLNGEKIPRLNQIKDIGIFIGPEGGWDPEEIAEAKLHNCILTKLSPLTFRAETAAIITSYLTTHPF